MTDRELNAIEQVRKLVDENPALQEQLRNAGDVPAVLDALRSFAMQQDQTPDMRQIAAGIEQLTEACNANRSLSDAGLESVAAGVDVARIFAAIGTLGISEIVEACVAADRKKAEGYAG